MTTRLDLFKCAICGNMVQVLLEGEGKLVCCNQDMEHLMPHSVEFEGGEKHVPIFVQNDCGSFEVRVGSMPHPMSHEHYIMLIQSVSGDKSKIYTEFLYPDNVPKSVLKGNFYPNTAIEYCNLHGLWEGKNDK